MKPSSALELHKSAIRAMTALFKAANPRVYGSVLHERDLEGCDILPLLKSAPPISQNKAGGGSWKRVIIAAFRRNRLPIAPGLARGRAVLYNRRIISGARGRNFQVRKRA